MPSQSLYFSTDVLDRCCSFSLSSFMSRTSCLFRAVNVLLGRSRASALYPCIANPSCHYFRHLQTSLLSQFSELNEITGHVYGSTRLVMEAFFFVARRTNDLSVNASRSLSQCTSIVISDVFMRDAKGREQDPCLADRKTKTYED